VYNNKMDLSEKDHSPSAYVIYNIYNVIL